MVASHHTVQFYEMDAFLLEAVSKFVAAALNRGEAGIVIATQAHREALEAQLTAGGIDIEAARDRGQYIAVDAADTLSRFLVDGAPDADRFATVIGGLIEQATSNWPGVRAFGEMVALLASEGNHAAAVQLEHLWNDLQQRQSFDLFCAYQVDQLDGNATPDLIDRVCGEHPSLADDEFVRERLDAWLG